MNKLVHADAKLCTNISIFWSYSSKTHSHYYYTLTRSTIRKLEFCNGTKMEVLHDGSCKFFKQYDHSKKNTVVGEGQLILQPSNESFWTENYNIKKQKGAALEERKDVDENKAIQKYKEARSVQKNE